VNAIVAIGILVLILAVPLALIGWLLARWFRKRGITGDSLETKLVPQSASGYWLAGTIRGVPVRLHWSLPLAGVLISVFAGFDPYEAIYYCIGYLVLIALHEFGHAAASRYFELRVVAVDISAFGGRCSTQIPRNAAQAFWVYSGGLLVQGALLLVAAGYWFEFGRPESSFARCVLQTFVFVNLFLLFGNIVPSRAGGVVSDGYYLWKLLLYALGKARYPFSEQFGESPVFPPATRLVERQDFVPADFKVGVGLLNDNSTPMEFVVGVLVKHLHLDRDQAIQAMLAIHRKGGLLLPLASLEDANAAAEGITRDAREQGHGLVCRAEARAIAGS
jgi:ATP-dependent Clp protease adaptor protein ClpS